MAEDLPDYLPMIDISNEPHDGSHGLFCPECMEINRWSEKEAPRG